MRLERAFRVAFEASANPMGLSDDDRVYRCVNRAACDFLGYEPEEFVGRRIESLYDDPRDRAHVVDGWPAFLHEGSTGGDVTFRAARGRQIHCYYHREANIPVAGLHLGVILLEPNPTVVEPGADRAALTARETQVMSLVADGLTSEEIGAELHISSETARTHVRNAMEKQGARTRAHLIALAFRQGILRP